MFIVNMNDQPQFQQLVRSEVCMWVSAEGGGDRTDTDLSLFPALTTAEVSALSPWAWPPSATSSSSRRSWSRCIPTETAWWRTCSGSPPAVSVKLPRNRDLTPLASKMSKQLQYYCTQSFIAQGKVEWWVWCDNTPDDLWTFGSIWPSVITTIWDTLSHGVQYNYISLWSFIVIRIILHQHELQIYNNRQYLSVTILRQ